MTTPRSEQDDFDPWTYFGLYSLSQMQRISDLLKSLGAEFYFIQVEETEERPKDWTAWDETAANPVEGHELFIAYRDLDKVGTHIIDIFPERKFGAA